MAGTNIRLPIQMAAPLEDGVVLERSSTGIVCSDPAQGMKLRPRFLCCAVLFRSRPCDGPIPHARHPTKILKRIHSFRSYY